jgi:Icc-related predicted phosphoesterase
MKIAYTADLHGSGAAYRHLFNAALRFRADAIIMGGDLLPYGGSSLENSPRSQRRYILTALRARLRELKKVAPDVVVCLILGNEDWAGGMGALERLESEDLCRVAHMKCVKLRAGFDLIGYSCVPPTPYSIQDWERRDRVADAPTPTKFDACVSEGTRMVRIDSVEYFNGQFSIEDDLAKLPTPRNGKKAVYVTHAPPYGTNCDVMYDLTHVGSKSIRALIERTQPTLTLHGHIHESPSLTGHWFDHVGATMCINVGKDGTGPKAALFKIGESGVDAYELL